MVPTFDDPDVLKANLSPFQCVASTFVPDPEGEYEFPEGTFRAVYFPVSRDANEDQMREIAFQVRNGVAMEQYQRYVIEEAKRIGSA